jgi:hypothetical protein
MPARQRKFSRQDAEMVAISALRRLAAEEDLLSRFCALTGVQPGDFRSAAGTPAFLCAVLDFYLGDEPSLLALAASENLDPSDIGRASALLGGDGGR